MLKFFKFKNVKTIVILMVLLAVQLSGCGVNNAKNTGKIEVVTTYYPLYSITENITDGIDNINLSLLADDSGVCIHDYSFKPEDFKKIETANLFIVSGFEDEFDDIIKTKEKQNGFILCDSSLNVNKIEDNQYTWLNPHNVIIQAKNISESMISLDPGNKEKYLANFEKFSSGVSENISKLKEELKPLENTNLVVFHEGFDYFAEAFNLKIKTYEPEHENGLSPKDVNEIVDYIKTNNVAALFDEESEESKLIPVIQEELQVKSFTLSAADHGDKGNKNQYVDTMNQNAATLLKAVQ